MWDRLTIADITDAREQIERRREDILRRQAQEISTLDAEAAEIAVLDRLAAAFWEKFKAATVTAEAAAGGDEREDEGRAPDHRTNFEVFSRAVSKSTF